MSKSDPSASRKERNKTIRWVVTIFIVTVIISGAISFVSDTIMENSSIAFAFVILLAIVFLGIIFDVIGVAVTSADEKPFHSMAARKVPGSNEAIRLLRNLWRCIRFCICNDCRPGAAFFCLHLASNDFVVDVCIGCWPDCRW